jgi:hypothetical protein
MKSTSALSLFMLLFSPTIGRGQGLTTIQPSDYFEVRVGGELKRSVLSFGVGRKFYVGDHVAVAPEIMVLGTPFLCATIRLDARLSDKMKLSPHFGFGLAPAGLSLSEALIIGGDVSYHINTHFILFLESRFYFINNNISSLGSGLLEINDLNRRRPVVLSLGLGF